MGVQNDAKTMGGITLKQHGGLHKWGRMMQRLEMKTQIAIGRDNTATHLDTIAIGR